LKEVYREFLGSFGTLTLLQKQSSVYDNLERSILLRFISVLRVLFIDFFKRKNTVLNYDIDVTQFICFKNDFSYIGSALYGRVHSLSSGVSDIVDFFKSSGFEVISGSEIETRNYNFNALNINSNHPAQGVSDTFYFDDDRLLRTHTSAVQIRVMKKRGMCFYGLISVGKVYRKDYDATHTPMFFQVEGLLVRKFVSFNNLIGVLVKFLNFFFNYNVQLRVRPTYFPFTEPSIEIDVRCFFCNIYTECCYCGNSGWIEVLGAGMVQKRVLVNCYIDPELQVGFAFGLGVDRLVALRNRILDIRLNFSNDYIYLRQL
jgi:phenylalanyl-tRNA synthetase alpha chain